MYNKNLTLIIGIIALLCSKTSLAQDNLWNSNRPDGHAPISVMGDHYHKKGEVMFSYRYMSMEMKGNLESSKEISNEDIYNQYMVAPEKMKMDMHMIGVMYAPSDNLTLMLMSNYLDNSMNSKNKTGKVMTMNSSGLGDITLTGLVKFVNKNHHSLHGNISLSIPTGNIKQSMEHVHKHGAETHHHRMKLAYPMQLGSGTWDPSFGATYLGQLNRFSWGVQTKYKFRLNENSENYKLGNQYELTGWGAIRLSDYFSFSTQLHYYDVSKNKVSKPHSHQKMMPLFNPNNSGRKQLDLGVGVNFYIPKNTLKNLRIGVEIEKPIYQKVNGIQMKNSLVTTMGIQYTL